jgi:hypothetical protein
MASSSKCPPGGVDSWAPVGENNCRRVGMGDAGPRIHLMNCILDYNPLRPRMCPLIESAVSSDKMFKADYKASLCPFVIARQ